MSWGPCVGVLGRFFFVVYSLVCGSHINDDARSKSHQISDFMCFVCYVGPHPAS